MDIAEPISGTHRDTVIRRVLRLARDGDHRARRVTLLGQPGAVPNRVGIVSPHRDADGELDAADLVAQVYAIAHECPSVTGTYTNGFWVGDDGSSYLMDAEMYENGHPEPDDAPREHD